MPHWKSLIIQEIEIKDLPIDNRISIDIPLENFNGRDKNVSFTVKSCFMMITLAILL